jgi:hypothetical protein
MLGEKFENYTTEKIGDMIADYENCCLFTKNSARDHTTTPIVTKALAVGGATSNFRPLGAAITIHDVPGDPHKATAPSS